MLLRQCALSGERFEISPRMIEICEQLGSPLPEFCFRESMRRQLCYRNYLTLYRRKSDKSGRSMVSFFAPDSPFTVYHRDEWFGDDWDPLDYGREISFDRSFHEQFAELQRVVPLWALQNTNTENSEYCSSIANAKNCYLSFVCYFNSEDIYCSYRTNASRDVCYSLYADWSELCFYSLQSRRCYGCVYCEECFGCRNCSFSYELDNCSDCLFCSNLKNQRFCIANQSYTEKEYRRLAGRFDFGSACAFSEAVERFTVLRREAVHRALAQRNCEDCTGHHLINCRECENTYEAEDCEKLSDCLSLAKASLFSRCLGATGGDLCYECSGTFGSTFCSFGLWCYSCYDCHYSINLHNCKHCFGCSGLRNKDYHILNRPYSKERYEALKTRILEHMRSVPLDDPGLIRPVSEDASFFLPRHAFTAYNTSHASFFYPLERSEAAKRGFLWREEPLTSAVEERVEPPAHIKDWPNEPVVLRSPQTGREFIPPRRMIERFQRANVWLITEHPIDYLKRRLGTLQYRQIERHSAKSGTTVLSVHSEEEAPCVYSNEEYLAEF